MRVKFLLALGRGVACMDEVFLAAFGLFCRPLSFRRVLDVSSFYNTLNVSVICTCSSICLDMYKRYAISSITSEMLKQNE